MSGIEINKWERLAESNPWWTILTEDKYRNTDDVKEDFFRSGVDEIAFIFAILQEKSIEFQAGTALDFGCGLGRLTQALSPKFDRVLGIDVSANMIKQAEDLNKFGDKCEYLLNQSENLQQIESATIDFIYSARVLQHLTKEQIILYLKEMIRILKQDAVLVVQIPRGASFRKKVKIFFKRHLPGPLLALYRKATTNTTAYMDMEWIIESEIASLVQNADARIIHVADADEFTSGYYSNLYFVRKM